MGRVPASFFGTFLDALFDTCTSDNFATSTLTASYYKPYNEHDTNTCYGILIWQSLLSKTLTLHMSSMNQVPLYRFLLATKPGMVA